MIFQCPGTTHITNFTRMPLQLVIPLQAINDKLRPGSIPTLYLSIIISWSIPKIEFSSSSFSGYEFCGLMTVAFVQSRPFRTEEEQLNAEVLYLAELDQAPFPGAKLNSDKRYYWPFSTILTSSSLGLLKYCSALSWSYFRPSRGHLQRPSSTSWMARLVNWSQEAEM